MPTIGAVTTWPSGCVFSLADAGGKGLFTKELEEALLRRDIDLAVHSMKDVPVKLPDSLKIAALLPREDPSDVFISNVASSLGAVPKNARVGTSSVRRQAQVARARPDVETILLRGNVDTRLAKLEADDYDAILLALAGLKRLGLASRATTMRGASNRVFTVHPNNPPRVSPDQLFSRPVALTGPGVIA